MMLNFLGASTGVVASATIGKMFIAAAFAVIYNYSAEIYPTVVRNAGTGFSSLFARIGSICAPQIHLLVSNGFVMYGSIVRALPGLPLSGLLR